MEKITIPDPCSENWEYMSLQEQGRFCSVCNKCVIDFTQMQPEEIQQVIIEKKGEKVCGKFYHNQLNLFNTSEKPESKFFEYIPSAMKDNKALLSLFSLILTVTGCSESKKRCAPIMGEYVVENDEAPLNDQFVMGKIDGAAIRNDSIAKINKKDSASTEMKSHK